MTALMPGGDYPELAERLWPGELVSWSAQGLCAQVDPELFFPEKGSLGVEDLGVDLFDDFAAVHALNVQIGDQVACDIWGAVGGLQTLLVQGGGYTRLPFTLAELEHFAGHGTLPEAGERR